MDWRLDRMYHPSHRVPNLIEAEHFFRKVFGRSSISLGEIQGARTTSVPAGYPSDYSHFTPISDVWFDCIDPCRYIVDGRQLYPTVTEPELSGFGWGVSGINQLWTLLQHCGIRCTDQLGWPATDPAPPRACFSESALFWTDPVDTGLRYEFYPTASIGSADPRSAEGWTIPPVDPADPVQIVRCSHHTVLTFDQDRALKFAVEVLGGSVLTEAKNEELGTASTYVELGGSVIEYAAPMDSDSLGWRALSATAPLDRYYTITWEVAQLEAIFLHLTACGLAFRASDDLVTLAPCEESLGIPWGFTISPPYLRKQ
jgi:hypothetical protein